MERIRATRDAARTERDPQTHQRRRHDAQTQRQRAALREPLGDHPQERRPVERLAQGVHRHGGELGRTALGRRDRHENDGSGEAESDGEGDCDRLSTTDGEGEIAYEADGRRWTVPARAWDAAPLAAGAEVAGGTVRRSILSSRVRVEERAVVEDSLLFDNVTVGEGAALRRCIVDKGVQIPAGESIGFDAAKDRERFTCSGNGVIVVPRCYRFA